MADFLNRNSSPAEKNGFREVLSEQIADTLWNKVFYTSNMSTLSVTNATATEDMTSRESDTTGGLFLTPLKESKFKTNFYLNTGQLNSVVYIASPGISTSSAIGTTIKDSAKSFVGIKINAGDVQLVSYNHNIGTETIIDTGLTITDNTTHVLEINYKPRGSTSIFLDNDYIGSIDSNLIDDDGFSNYFVYISSIKSNSGSVNITFDSYEYIQKR